MTDLKRYLKGAAYLFSRDRYKRRRVLQELARVSASFFGDFPISEDHKIWREDRAFLADYSRLSPSNPYSADRKFTLREMVRYARGIPGEMAECGCFRGASAWFIANGAPGVPLHLFDSFAGLSQPSKKDRLPDDSMSFWSKGALSASEEEVRTTLGSLPNIRIHKGWIPESFSSVEHLQFSLVHIDVDLYQPTWDSLTFFYPRLSSNGVIVLDDYGFKTCPGAFKASEEFSNEVDDYIIHLPTGQGVIIKKETHSDSRKVSNCTAAELV